MVCRRQWRGRTGSTWNPLPFTRSAICSGLGHSALGETELRDGGRRVLAAEAVMFPVAFSAGSITGRTLRADDIAGISDIYPPNIYKRERGSISGRVTKRVTGGARRACRRVQPADRQTGRRVLIER